MKKVFRIHLVLYEIDVDEKGDEVKTEVLEEEDIRAYLDEVNCREEFKRVHARELAERP